MKMIDKNIFDLTDEDILSSLKVIATTRNCNECKIRNCKWGTCNCEQITANAALELINRQKSEIERLRAKVETRTQEKLALGRIYTQKLKTVKYETFYEAYKEFAERIRACCDLNDDLSTDAWLSVIADIDRVLKEMVGNSE